MSKENIDLDELLSGGELLPELDELFADEGGLDEPLKVDQVKIDDERDKEKAEKEADREAKKAIKQKRKLDKKSQKLIKKSQKQLKKQNKKAENQAKKHQVENQAEQFQEDTKKSKKNAKISKNSQKNQKIEKTAEKRPQTQETKGIERSIEGEFSGENEAFEPETAKAKSIEIDAEFEAKTVREQVLDEMKAAKAEALKRRRRKRTITVIALVCAVLAVLFGLFFAAYVDLHKPPETLSAVKSKGSFPIAATEDIKAVEATGSGFYMLSGTNLNAFSFSGEQTGEFKLNFSDPFLSAGKDALLAYDLQGNAVAIYSGGVLLNEHKSKDECQIVCATMGDTGDYVVVTRPQVSSPYATTLTFYDKMSRELFSWHCKDYIVNVQLSPNSAYILAAGVNTKLIKVYTELYALPVTQFAAGDDSGLTVQHFNSAVFSMNFADGKNVVVNLPDRRVTYNIQDYEATAVAVDLQGEVQFIRNDKKGNTAIVSNINGTLTLLLYDKSGSLLFQTELSDQVYDICLRNKAVLVLYGHSLESISGAEMRRTLVNFEMMQKNVICYGKHIYTNSTNYLFNYENKY